ncbi:hypothetical protein [Kocuria sp. UBA1838]|uniref:hypothetical protein n=1 Tax=Kocuria sp. UBA1838 TaxID=1946673 RepID=UPI002580B5AE|nr:hypothetical protein [Kocuria sp. UBA1838]
MIAGLVTGVLLTLVASWARRGGTRRSARLPLRRRHSDAAQRLDVQEATKLEESVAKILHVGTDELGGALLEKAGYVNLLDILLAVMLALLAVAMVVFVLGIASTTSLSVLEPSRENSPGRTPCCERWGCPSGNSGRSSGGKPS